MSWIYKLLLNSHQCLPQIFSIPLQDIVCFDFVTALLALLNNQILMQPHNLVLDINNPLAQYEPLDNCFGGAHSGQHYCDLYAPLATDPARQLLVPIIVYLDGTAIDSKGHSVPCFIYHVTIHRKTAPRCECMANLGICAQSKLWPIQCKEHDGSKCCSNS
jgi:hypothetical protein